MDTLLTSLGARLRAVRRERGWTLKELAARSGLSQRFMSQLENGQGNISVRRLARVASTLDLRLADLFADIESPVGSSDPGPQVVALLGVRGAGKSAVGIALASALQLEFVELDVHVEARSGLGLGELFAIHGESYYRRVEHEVLQDFIGTRRRAVLATGGSLVTHPQSWALLRHNAVCIWLRAGAKEHWERVIAQGDDRPMRENPHAYAQLEALLAERAPLYAQAHHIVETSGQTVGEVVARTLEALESA